MRKLQLSLTSQESALLSRKASTLGYDVTKFVKFLISREAFSVAEKCPTYQLSAKAEAVAEETLREHHRGQSVEISNPRDLERL